ncbi:alpha/beta fold hydrolase [bacterium]|nr:alpha/beta fold hydrolase [bacterium]
MLRRALAPGQPSRRRRLAAAARYNAFFAGALWRVYVTPQIAAWRRRRHLAATRQSPIAIGTPRGASDPGDLVTTHYVETDDGLTLTLLRVRRPAPGPAPGAVLLLHGLTSSSDMFIMPEHRNVVRYLLEHGFTDVWCADFRMSGRFVHNLRRQRDTMDDVALFDHPALIAAVRAAIGPERNLHVVAHCLGSLTFMMSLAAGRVAGIASVVCNSVALTPRVPWWSRVKLRVAPFLVETLLGRPYVTARWRDQPGLTRSELVARLVSWWHRECDEPACHMVSMMWGSGDPALFNHANLHAVTHQRIGDLFGGSSMTYYRHVRAMVRRGVACTLRREPRYRELPASYAAAAHALTTPVLFLCGDHNNVFTDSNPHCFERLHTYAPAAARSLFELRVVPGYGHQDIFMGRDSDRDVFPHIADFLRRRGG